jgi:hypothetical protein
MQYSYIAYPYESLGSVRMSGDRQAYFRDRMTKEGNVPEPIRQNRPHVFCLWRCLRRSQGWVLPIQLSGYSAA